MFSNEALLVYHFITTIKDTSPWGGLRIGTEFNYQRGCTDLVAVSDNGKVLAFEAKLTKWKIALHQAYRNQCFADYSYVLLPKESAKKAINCIDDFIKRRVGLCCIAKDGVKVVFAAPETKPLQPWLHEKAFNYAISMEVG